MHEVQTRVYARDESQLVKAAQQGCRSAMADLVELHYESARNTAFVLLRNREEAEDEVQNACLKAWQHIDQFQCAAKFSTWLTRIVINQCLMRLRTHRRAKFESLDEPAGGENQRSRDIADAAETPEESCWRNELGRLIHHQICRVPGSLRQVLVLRDLHGLPGQAAARCLGISNAAAKSRLIRARREARRLLEKHVNVSA